VELRAWLLPLRAVGELASVLCVSEKKERKKEKGEKEGGSKTKSKDKWEERGGEPVSLRTQKLGLFTRPKLHLCMHFFMC
jgi:hypothetical protein